MQIDTREFSAGVRRAEGRFKSAMTRMQAGARQFFGVLGGAGALVGFGGLTVALTKAVRTASDFEETFSKFKAVFKEQSDAALAFANDLTQSLGRSRLETLGFLATLQDTFVPLGFARDRARELSQELVKLTFDLASFNNKADADVLRDLQSTLVGNTETVRKYGIIITQAALDQELLNLGFAGGVKQASEQEKVLGRLSIIMRSTTDAQGDAARTADSFANQLKAMNAAIEDLLVAVGNELIPQLKVVVQQSAEWARVNKEEVSKGVSDLVKVMEPLVKVTKLVIEGWAGLIDTWENGILGIKNLNAELDELGKREMAAAGNAFERVDVMARNAQRAQIRQELAQVNQQGPMTGLTPAIIESFARRGVGPGSAGGAGGGAGGAGGPLAGITQGLLAARGGSGGGSFDEAAKQLERFAKKGINAVFEGGQKVAAVMKKMQANAEEFLKSLGTLRQLLSEGFGLKQSLELMKMMGIESENVNQAFLSMVSEGLVVLNPKLKETKGLLEDLGISQEKFNDAAEVFTRSVDAAAKKAEFLLKFVRPDQLPAALEKLGFSAQQAQAGIAKLQNQMGRLNRQARRTPSALQRANSMMNTMGLTIRNTLGRAFGQINQAMGQFINSLDQMRDRQAFIGQFLEAQQAAIQLNSQIGLGTITPRGSPLGERSTPIFTPAGNPTPAAININVNGGGGEGIVAEIERALTKRGVSLTNRNQLRLTRRRG